MRAIVFAALSLMVSSSCNDEPAKTVTKAAPRPSERPGPSVEHFFKKPEFKPKRIANAEALAMVHRIMNREAVAYSQKFETLVWANLEGTSTKGLVAVMARVGPGIAQLLATVRAARIEAERQHAAEEVGKLLDAGFVTLNKVQWPEGAEELEHAELGLRLRYSRDTLSVSPLDQISYNLIQRNQADATYDRRPEAVYANKDFDLFLVEYVYTAKKGVDAIELHKLDLFDRSKTNFRPEGPYLYAPPLTQGRVLERTPDVIRARHGSPPPGYKPRKPPAKAPAPKPSPAPK